MRSLGLSIRMATLPVLNTPDIGQAHDYANRNKDDAGYDACPVFESTELVEDAAQRLAPHCDQNGKNYHWHGCSYSVK